MLLERSIAIVLFFFVFSFCANCRNYFRSQLRRTYHVYCSIYLASEVDLRFLNLYADSSLGCQKGGGGEVDAVGWVMAHLPIR